MIKKLLLIILIILITGCAAKQKEVVVLTKYVCPDGWVVASLDRCPKSEIRAQEPPEIPEQNIETLPLKSPYMSAPELNQISEDVLNKINEERGKLDLEPYQQSMELQSAAQDFSVKYLQEGYISSENLSQRLEANTIFYFESAENLAILSLTDTANIGADSVQKWIEIPDKKQLLLDTDFTHIGTGISCSLENCYVVLDLISAKRFKHFIIEPGSHAFESMYNDSIPYNISINFTIYLNSKQSFDFYIVANESSYERFTQHMRYDPVTFEKDIKNTTFSITAEKGYGIILIPQEKYSDTVIFYEQEFNGFAK
jgi:uncharacterized protein YkwD